MKVGLILKGWYLVKKKKRATQEEKERHTEHLNYFYWPITITIRALKSQIVWENKSKIIW